MKLGTISFALILALSASAAFSLNAQILNVNASGEKLPDIWSKRFNQTLIKEVEFYGPLGLADTVSVNLVVFKDRDKANAYLSQYDPMIYGRRYSGMFIHDTRTAVILVSNDLNKSLGTVFHEISHFLYHSVLSGSKYPSSYSSYCLNEGIAEYFSYMRVKNDGKTVQQDDSYALNSVKSLIEIDEFNLDEYLSMGQSRFNDKSSSDTNISYHVSYVIVLTLFNKLGDDGMRNLLSMIKNGYSFSSAVDTLYPGGKQSLDQDIRAIASVK